MVLRPFTSPEHWRSRAKEIRQLAEDLRNPGIKASMSRIANDYEHLAQRADEHLRKPIR
jgi:hypothetical protein